MDDMTFVYFSPDADSDKKMPFSDLQFAFIQNDSDKNLVRIKDRKLAELLKIE